MIETDDLLKWLEEEEEKVRKILPSEAEVGSSDHTFVTELAAKFSEIIKTHGKIENVKSMDELCASLQRSQRELEAKGVSEKLVKKIDYIRRKIRRELRIEQGWEKEPFVKGKKLTLHGVNVVNLARESFGLSRVHVEGDVMLTEEQLSTYRAIAKELGEVAFAEFMCLTQPDKFSFNNRTIQNLRKWLGDIEVYRGNPIDDIPSAILSQPELSMLRQLLFNSQRDKYFLLYKKGIGEVLAELDSARERTDEPERLEFIDELQEYFLEVDAIRCPQRMKSSFGSGSVFPERHQLIAMKEIEEKRQLLIADQMGGGKTGSAIAGFEKLRDEGKAKRALILCPSEIINDWQKRLSVGQEGYFQEGKEPKIAVIRSGDRDREATWENAADADYVLMSIEMTRMSTGDVSHEELAKKVGADYLVLDEAHNVKNPNGEDTERIFRISQCDSIRNGFTVLLSGTPVPNTIQDIAAQLRLLNAGQSRLKDLNGSMQTVDFTNIRQLTKAISRNHTRTVRNLLLLRMLNRNTEDCLPVGTKIIIEEPREAEMTYLEQAYYQSIVDDPFFTATMKIQLLRKICAHPRALPGSIGTGETKYRELKNAVEEFMQELRDNPDAHSGKIVIASEGYARGVSRDFNDNNNLETSELETYLAGRLHKEYGSKGIPIIILDGNNTGTKHLHDGNVPLWDEDGAPLTDTRKVIARFRRHKGPAILFTRTDVIGEGIALTFASRGILITPTPNHSIRDQFIRRMYRRGQLNDVRLITLLIANSIEKGIAEYANCKQQIINDLIHGRPLSAAEEAVMNENTNNVREGGSYAYETMSPKRKVMWIFNKIFGSGKEHVREFFELSNGKYAKELPQLYYEDWETSFAGNNTRLILALLEDAIPKLKKDLKAQHLNVADIACGGLTMARIFKERKDLTVRSSDINPGMLEIGRRMYGDGVCEDHISNSAMDELPYPDASQHIAVHSLSLQYTKHSLHSKNGKERIDALREINRVLVPGGIGIISLPPHIFNGKDPQKFQKVQDVLSTYFGFEVITPLTGHAVSVDNRDEEDFEGYILTVRKVGKTKEKEMPTSAWRELVFGSKEAAKKARDYHDIVRKPSKAIPKTNGGSYHEMFTLNGRVVESQMPNGFREKKEEYAKSKKEYITVRNRVQILLEEHESLDKIPTEKLLSISLDELSESNQYARDEYFRRLLRQYKSIDHIPVEKISKQSNIILLRGETKRGQFVCLARTDGQRKGGYGKRYFYETEFVNGN